MPRPRNRRPGVSDDTEPGLVVERPSWHRFAACRGEGTDAFFPAGNNAGHVARRTVSVYCVACPVARECDEVGDAEHYGVWGGQLRLKGWRANRRAS